MTITTALTMGEALANLPTGDGWAITIAENGTAYLEIRRIPPLSVPVDTSGHQAANRAARRIAGALGGALTGISSEMTLAQWPGLARALYEVTVTSDQGLHALAAPLDEGRIVASPCWPGSRRMILQDRSGRRLGILDSPA